MAIKINLFLSTFCLTTIFLVSAVLEGPNVCVRQENYTVTVNISEQKSYKLKTTTWCVAFPPKCSSYKTIVRTVYTTQVLQKQRPVEECCKGYGETATGDKCVPMCSEGCKHGSCIAPDSCICEAGYGGLACDTKCSKGTWGSRCIHKCDCSNDTDCNPFDGKCDCTENCDDKYNSPNFSKGFCNCKNENYVCHPTDGCVCMYGYTGSTCEEPLFTKNVSQQKTESSYSGIFFAALFLACLAILIMIAELIYHRRRVEHVQLTAKPVIPTDRFSISLENFFDNPLYASVTSEPENLNIDRNESDEEHKYEVPHFCNNDTDYNHLDHVRSQNNRKSNYQKIFIHQYRGNSEMTNQNDGQSLI